MAKDKIVILRYSALQAEVSVLQNVGGRHRYVVKNAEEKGIGSEALTEQLINLVLRKSGQQLPTTDSALRAEALKCRKELINYDTEFSFADGTTVEVEQYEFENASLMVTNRLLSFVSTSMGNTAEIDRIMFTADDVDEALLRSLFVRNYSASVGNSRTESEWLSMNDKAAVARLLADADAYTEPKPTEKKTAEKKPTEKTPRPNPSATSRPSSSQTSGSRSYTQTASRPASTQTASRPSTSQPAKKTGSRIISILLIAVAVVVASFIGLAILGYALSKNKGSATTTEVDYTSIVTDDYNAEPVDAEEVVAPSEGNSEVDPKLRYDYVYSESDGMRKVEKNGKKGLIDSKGREVVVPQYDYIYSKSDGLYKVEKNGKKGYIRADGSVFIPVKYDYIYSKQNGVYKVELNSKKGFVDANTGKELCPPKYDYIYSEKDGLYKVELNGKKGFLDSNYQEILPPTYDYIYSFSGGLAKVELGRKIGYINKQGKLVQPLE